MTLENAQFTEEVLSENHDQARLIKDLWVEVHSRESVTEQKNLDYNLLLTQYNGVKKDRHQYNSCSDDLINILKENLRRRDTEVRVLEKQVLDLEKDKNDLFLSKENQISL